MLSLQCGDESIPDCQVVNWRSAWDVEEGMKFHFLFPILCTAFVWIQPLQAEWKSSGSTQVFYQQYGFPSSAKFANQVVGLDLNLKTDWKANKQWRLRTDLELLSDQASKDSEERTQFNPKSFFIENKSTPVVLRFGFQTVVPDGPDILNPADVIHSKNWKDPTTTQNLGSAGLSLSQELDVWQWEIFYIPQQTKPILPGEQSPWWPREKRLPLESEFVTEAKIPSDIDYKIADAVEINDALKNNYAVRLQRKSEAFESQLVYYQGLSQDPHLFFNASSTNFVLDSPVLLIPFYYRHQVVAGTFVLPLKSWSLKGGANWIKPLGTDARLPGEESTAVIGVEKNIETRKGILTVLIQHESQKRQAQDQISFLRSIFENAWSLGLRVPWGEDTQLIGGVIYDTVGKSSVSKLSITRRLTDSFSINVDGQWLEGPDDTLVGLYTKYDRYGLGLTYFW